MGAYQTAVTAQQQQYVGTAFFLLCWVYTGRINHLGVRQCPLQVRTRNTTDFTSMVCRRPAFLGASQGPLLAVCAFSTEPTRSSISTYYTPRLWGAAQPVSASGRNISKLGRHKMRQKKQPVTENTERLHLLDLQTVQQQLLTSDHSPRN